MICEIRRLHHQVRKEIPHALRRLPEAASDLVPASSSKALSAIGVPFSPTWSRTARAKSWPNFHASTSPAVGIFCERSSAIESRGLDSRPVRLAISIS